MFTITLKDVPGRHERTPDLAWCYGILRIFFIQDWFMGSHDSDQASPIVITTTQLDAFSTSSVPAQQTDTRPCYDLQCTGACSWWRHQMETFSALLAICAGNSPGTGEFPAQRPVTRSFDIFFDLRLNKWLSKQWWCWWFETLSPPLWRHCNVVNKYWYKNKACADAADSQHR